MRRHGKPQDLGDQSWTAVSLESKARTITAEQAAAAAVRGQRGGRRFVVPVRHIGEAGVRAGGELGYLSTNASDKVTSSQINGY
jgi:hypothetical protein